MRIGSRRTSFVPMAILLAGCSAGQVAPRPVGMRGPHDSDPATANATVQAGAARRPFKPIPEVIRRAKPFHLAGHTAAAPGGAVVHAGHAEPAATSHAAPPRLPAAADHPTVAEVRGMLRSYLRAFNRHDAAALAAHWSESGENLDLDSGEVTAAGRGAVHDVFAALFAADDEATIDIDVHAIRPIREDVAVVDGVSLISFADGTPASSRFSAVVVKQDGQWVLDNVREAAAPAPAVAARRPLEELGWLVGSWEDDGAGVIAGTRCAWSPGRGFLVRTHSIEPAVAAAPASGDDRTPALLPTTDCKPREITEVIGWDPDADSIRSWLFSGDGRFAEATWHRDGDRWTIAVVGRGRDEGATATCTLEPAAGDTLVIRGDAGRLSALLPPACPFTRTSR